MKESKYIRFVKVAEKPKTSVWDVINKSGEYSIGVIKWNPGWRQYCFFPEQGMVFSVGCMQDICKFIEEVSHARVN